MTTPAFFLLLLSLAATAPGEERTVAFEDLLREMVSLDWLATPPPEGERCIQFSSYDRRSDKGRSDPEAWFANDDRGRFLRSEKRGDRTEWVLAEVEGPGAVVRIWSANPGGDLRFYLDGAEEPALAIPFQDLTGGKKPPFVEPLAGVRARGWNCHVPFPFQKRLKLTATANDFYYHVNVRLFPPGTRVPSFKRDDLRSPVLEKVAERLRSPAEPDPGETLERGRDEGNSIRPGGFGVWRWEDPGTLRWLEIRPLADDLRQSLRSVRLQMYFDEQRTPSVDVPLGDFFGTAPDFTPYKTWLLGVKEDGTGYSRFPIPWVRGAAIVLRNEGQLPFPYALYTTVDSRTPPAPLRFRARWRSRRDLGTRPRSDFVVLDAGGPGRFVGCALSVRNPVRAWWGEGDEHAWVDHEEFPSTFGTGTEDYFGYAWCSPERFESTFHSQSRCDGPGNRGFTSVNRFHLLDAIPFQKHLRFDLEVWHWADCSLDFATVAYWYSAPGAGDAMEALPPVEERLARPLPPIESRHPGAIEGEALLDRAGAGGGKLQVQDMTGFGDAWSRDEQLWWTGGKPGDRLDLPFEVPEEGTFVLRAQLTRARDYAVVQVLLDGEELGEPIDLYNDGVVATGDLELGRVTLSAGSHTLALVIRGANDKAEKAYMVGLDYVRLVR